MQFEKDTFGIVKVSNSFLSECSDLLLRAMHELNLLPVKIDRDLTYISYYFYCPDFDEVEEGAAIPEYTLNLKIDDSGNAKFGVKKND